MILNFRPLYCTTISRSAFLTSTLSQMSHRTSSSAEIISRLSLSALRSRLIGAMGVLRSARLAFFAPASSSAGSSNNFTPLSILAISLLKQGHLMKEQEKSA